MDNFQHSAVFSCKFNYWQNNALEFLETSGLGKMLDGNQTVLIKPNLVENLAPPITTPVGMVEKVAEYLLDYLPPSKVLIGEGCGATDYDTHHAFTQLGYTELAEKLHIRLIDLNQEKLCRKTNPDCSRWPEIYLPELLDTVFLLSMPQLKAHSLSGVTLTMKNMMGCAPPCHYRKGGAWNKAAFHTNLQEAIFDLNRSFGDKRRGGPRTLSGWGFSPQAPVRPHSRRHDSRRPIGLRSGSYWESRSGAQLYGSLLLHSVHSANAACRP
jgi:uncharacterized protein (DUF362 family)